MEEDCRSAEARLCSDITRLNEDLKKNVLKLKDLVKEFTKNQIKTVYEQLTLAEMDMKVGELERNSQNIALQAQREYDESKTETGRCRELLERAKRDAEQVAPNPHELRDMFSRMPDTVEDIEDAISDILAEANAVPCNNPGIGILHQERSVSTILYLVSLQDLTHCPFRVVDVINQGMDFLNERNMFQQLVRAASQLNTPQCFLLTPKLLPNLEYTEACTILNIMNGPYVDEASESKY